MTEPWTLLETGDRFSITSYSGKKYEATFLLAGPQEAGLYVRLQDRKLARFSPGRLIWTSLEKMSSANDVIIPGDDVLVQPKESGECVGKLVEAKDTKLTIKTSAGKTIVLPAESAVAGSFRLLFPASDLRAGDEFLVRSTSGREYRGRANVVERDRILATLISGGEPVSLRVEHLDLRSLYVLIPLDAAGISPRA